MSAAQNKPAHISEGERIAIVAPAGAFERSGWERAKDFIGRQGYQPVWRDDIFEVAGYLAGSDERRAAELMWAFGDPQVKAIVAVRGGYGNMRLLESLDFELIKRNPRIFMGFSDNSALLLALMAKCDAKCIHGPHFLILPDSPGEVVSRCFRMISDPTAAGSLFDSRLQILRSGLAEGKLICTNLSLLTNLLGTPYMPDLDGCILVIEDVNEETYRVDRMLTHLKLAGVLSKLAGLALGAFTLTGNQAVHDKLVAERAFELTEAYGYPLLAGLPVGHIPGNYPVPCGIQARLDGENGRLEALEALTI